MYYIFEIQKQLDGTCAHLLTTAETENEAKSKFHQVMAAAAISSVPIHTAVVLTDEGVPIMRETYRHIGEEE